MPKKKIKKKSLTNRCGFRIPGHLLQNFNADDCCNTLGFSRKELGDTIEELEQMGAIAPRTIKI